MSDFFLVCLLPNHVDHRIEQYRIDSLIFLPQKLSSTLHRDANAFIATEQKKAFEAAIIPI